MRLTGISGRLLAVTLVTLAAGLAVLMTAGNVLLANTVAGDNAQRLSARLDAEVATLSESHGQVRVRDPLNDESLDAYGWIYANGRVIERPSRSTPSLNALAGSLARVARTPRRRGTGSSDDILLGSRLLRTGAGSAPVATVVAGVDVAQLEALRAKVLWGSIALALLVLAGAGLVIGRVLTAVLAPVQQMTRLAEDWQAHDLDRRFGLGAPRDELTGLAATLDHLLDRIAASRRHEQRFAAEVAHELRTPLTAIRGAAELASGTDAHRSQIALSDIIAHSDRMSTTLDTLIAHARQETQPAVDGVDLAAVVASFPRVTLQQPSEPGARVEGHVGLIRQLLAPIIENAERHAVSGVSVEVVAGVRDIRAVIRDDGCGVDPALGVSVFEPGVRGRHETVDGAGLGLSLARRLAHSCGGDIQLGPGPGGCFVVSLPRSIPQSWTH